MVSLKELMSCIRQGRPETQLWRPHWVVRYALNLVFGCHDPDMVLQFPGSSYTSTLALLAGQIPPYHYLALQSGWVVSCNRREKKNNQIAVKGTERNREINAGSRSVAFLKTISCNISMHLCTVQLHCVVSSAVITYICALIMCTAPIFISKILPTSFPPPPRFTTSPQSCSNLFANLKLYINIF